MTDNQMKHVEPSSLPDIESASICLLDVRTPVEFRDFHVLGAKNIPLDQLTAEQALELAGTKEKPLYLLCRSGSRAKIAAERLSAAGFPHVFCVTGGAVACRNHGLKCVTGERQVISLERQVRIAAGSLVLLGMLLGVFLHGAFYALSAFVGAGLIFAGLTDWCGMGLLLSKMPWNR